jgi:hypothetical protein
LKSLRLASAVLGAFVRIVLAYHSRRARRAGIAAPHACAHAHASLAVSWNVGFVTTGA